MATASELNRAYYGDATDGLLDYWRLMAAPRHRAAELLRTLGEESFLSVVDLGCGNGLLLSEIAARFPHSALAGIDIAADLVEGNRRRSPRIQWYVADLSEPLLRPELRETFDVVVACEIVEHLDAPEVFLRNACTLCRPGGRLLLSTQSGPVRETERRVGHRRHFTRDTLSEVIRGAGWEPTHVWNTGFPFHDLSKWVANLDPDKAMGEFGSERYGWKQRVVCAGLRVAFRLNSRRRGAQLFAAARNPRSSRQDPS